MLSKQSRIIFCFLLGLYSVFWAAHSIAQEESATDYQKQQQDLKAFLQVLETYQNSPLREKIRGLEQYMEDNPDSALKEEARKNIESMEALLRSQDEKTLSASAKDREDYENFRNSVAALPLSQQLARYNEYIDTNPSNSVIESIKSDRDSIKARIAASEAKPTVVKKPDDKPMEPIVPQVDLKDPKHALFLAGVPGFFVPGIGVFYAGETATGITLVIVRATGIGLGLFGILKKNNALIVTGALAYGLSWIVDIAAAPIYTRDYNEKLEQKAAAKMTPFIMVADKSPVLGFSLSF